MLKMEKEESYKETGSPRKRSILYGSSPSFRRKQIAVKPRSQPKEQFSNLMHHLSIELVRQCLEKMPKATTPGADGMTVGECLANLDWILPPILDSIHRGQYVAPPVKRIYIPKASGGQRPIGIPQVLDRAIQTAMAVILNEIYEQDFLNCSFGFRPNIGCHNAVATINKVICQKMNYALEVDFRDFFGSLKHDWLRQFLRHRIGDKRVLNLIDSWLKAGVLEGDQYHESKEGTPQGGSISPLLANIYLHYVLDLWWEKKIKSRLVGKGHMVRYCDDFVLLFTHSRDRKSIDILLRQRIAKFGLSIAEDKTHTSDLSPGVASK